MYRCAESMLASIGQEKAGQRHRTHRTTTVDEATVWFLFLKPGKISLSKVEGRFSSIFTCCHDNQHTKLTVLVSFPYRTLLLNFAPVSEIYSHDLSFKEMFFSLLDVCV